MRERRAYRCRVCGEVGHNARTCRRAARPSPTPRVRTRRPRPAWHALIGTAPDAEVARMAGVSRQAVSFARIRDGLPAYTGPRKGSPLADGVLAFVSGAGRPVRLTEVAAGVGRGVAEVASSMAVLVRRGSVGPGGP